MTLSDPTTGTLPILLLDVDGVLNAVTRTDPRTWNDWRVNRANGIPIRWSPSMIAALTRLSERVEMRWLTTWWDMTYRLEFLGLPPMKVANTRDEYLDRTGGPLSWWKLATAKRVVAEGRPVIWIDDDLAHVPEALEWGKSLPKGTLLGISPATFRGITPRTIEEIEYWLDTRDAQDAPSSAGDAR
jgi:hypothetical protein